MSRGAMLSLDRRLPEVRALSDRFLQLETRWRNATNELAWAKGADDEPRATVARAELARVETETDAAKLELALVRREQHGA